MKELSVKQIKKIIYDELSADNGICITPDSTPLMNNLEKYLWIYGNRYSGFLRKIPVVKIVLRKCYYILANKSTV
jgi:hypothetical protein